MERFTEGEITVPEGLTRDISHEYFLMRAKEGSRVWVTRTAEETGKSLEAVQAQALSPSEEALLTHFGAIAKNDMKESGAISPADLTSWGSGAEDAHSLLFSFWTHDMADFDKDTGWTFTAYGVEVHDALLKQYKRGRLGRLITGR